MLPRLAPRPIRVRERGGAADEAERPLRIALLVYRGNPRCGGQGVYVRHVSRALVDLGHTVEVFSGPPYPELDPRVALTRIPSLDLYRQPDPFRIPGLGEFHSLVDVAEFATMCVAGFPEPLTFSLRCWPVLRRRLSDFDVVHDNQSLGYGFLPLLLRGFPTVATIHHPITVDRRLDLAAAETLLKRISTRRWYAFTRMQSRVARRHRRVLTVSTSSLDDLVSELGIRRDRLHLVRLGVDTDRFRPRPDHVRVPGRILTTASADVPLKGLVHLITALPSVRARHPLAHLVVVGRARPDGPVRATIERLGLTDVIRFEHGIADERINDLYAEAEVAVVPSLYEGFSLPAVEAMAAGCPLVATAAGALPEVVGPDGEAAILVPPADDAAIGAALDRLLGDAALRAQLGAGGRARALALYSWPATATATVRHYRAAIAEARRGGREAAVGC